MFLLFLVLREMKEGSIILGDWLSISVAHYTVPKCHKLSCECKHGGVVH